jgi:SPP1 family predicted phage head-tail adaptor
MLWRDVVSLISVAEVEVSQNVFQLAESSRSVFANKKSVNRDEFYKAYANALRPTVAFDIRAAEYSGEQKLRHNGTDYMIIRTYSRNDETIELVCQAFDDVQTNLAHLRDTVEIWHNTFIENSMGERSPMEKRLFTLPARVEYRGGKSGIADGVIETTNNVIVTIRYREGITPDMFLKIGGQRFDIRYIEDPFNRHETLILTAERVVP